MTKSNTNKSQLFDAKIINHIHLNKILILYIMVIIPENNTVHSKNSPYYSEDFNDNIPQENIKLCFNFHAGQYINIILEDKVRSYSIANAFNKNNILELHIKTYTGGLMTEYLNKLLISNNPILSIDAPLGHFALNTLNNNTNNIIFACTGTGFAPIKALIETLIQQKSIKKIYLYWGNRYESDFYCLSDLKKWQEVLNIEIYTCVSSNDTNKKNYITTMIKEHFIDLLQYEIYASGNLNMIHDLYQIAINLGLESNMFFSDVFIPKI